MVLKVLKISKTLEIIWNNLILPNTFGNTFKMLYGIIKWPKTSKIVFNMPEASTIILKASKIW